MEDKNRNWLIGITVIIIVAAVLIAVFWANGRQKDIGETGSEAPAASGSEAEDPADSRLQSYMHEQDTIMAEMMEGMGAVPETGNASVHFLKGMTPHHESAIDMAESYLKYGGQNEKLKKLAEDIISAQTEEIKEMDAMIKRIEESGATDADKEASYLSAYQKMMQSHEHAGHGGHSAPADVEQAFAEGMTLHHQMAVEMAEAILDYTDEDDVRLLAQTIIKTQKQEIEEMQNIRNELETAS